MGVTYGSAFVFDEGIHARDNVITKLNLVITELNDAITDLSKVQGIGTELYIARLNKEIKEYEAVLKAVKAINSGVRD